MTGSASTRASSAADADSSLRPSAFNWSHKVCDVTTRIVPLKDALLPRERDVIEILVDGDLDGEGERIATARRRALGPWCRLDAAAALADVLLLFDLHDAVADLDDVDHLACLELLLHRCQRAAAARTRLVGCVEPEDLFDDRELWLRRRPELLALLLARRGDLLELLDLGDKVLLLTRHVFEEHELLLKVFAYVLLPQDLQELLNLDLLREGNASQLLDVLLAPQVHERTGKFCFGVVDPLRAFFYRPRAVGSITAGDRARRPTSSQPSMKRASSLDVRCTTVPSFFHGDAKRPRSSRF